MPINPRRKIKKQIKARRRRIRKEWDDVDENIMAISTGAAPKDAGK